MISVSQLACRAISAYDRLLLITTFRLSDRETILSARRNPTHIGTHYEWTCVCLSVCHTPVLHGNRRTGRARSGFGGNSDTSKNRGCFPLNICFNSEFKIISPYSKLPSTSFDRRTSIASLSHYASVFVYNTMCVVHRVARSVCIRQLGLQLIDRLRATR